MTIAQFSKILQQGHSDESADPLHFMLCFRPDSNVKRLWKHHLKLCNEASCKVENCHEKSELKSITHSFLKHLPDNSVSLLLESVENGPEEDGKCIPVKVTCKSEGYLRLGKHSIQPHVLCVKLWRFPNLPLDTPLKQMCSCTVPLSPGLSSGICCNPFHWSLLPAVNESQDYCQDNDAPPPYSPARSDGCSGGEGELPSPPPSLSSPPHIQRASWLAWDAATTLSSPPRDEDVAMGWSEEDEWGLLRYWEHRTPVGRQHSARGPCLHVFQRHSRGSGLCLAHMQEAQEEDSRNTKETEAVRRARSKIGLGVRLWVEGPQVWVYNMSPAPVFITSPYFWRVGRGREEGEKEGQPGRAAYTGPEIIKRLQPWHSTVIYDTGHQPQPEDPSATASYDVTESSGIPCGSYDPHAVRISFGKGWGPNYKRTVIDACPCWLEILFRIVDR